MSFFNNIHKEDGYTLIETIVAMALFLSVLIPLVTIMGNTMLDRKANLTSKALALAVSEMNMTAGTRDFSDMQKTTGDGFIIQRNIQKSSSLTEVEVVIKITGDQPKEILRLKRIFLVYQ